MFAKTNLMYNDGLSSFVRAKCKFDDFITDKAGQ